MQTDQNKKGKRIVVLISCLMAVKIVKRKFKIDNLIEQKSKSQCFGYPRETNLNGKR